MKFIITEYHTKPDATIVHCLNEESDRRVKITVPLVAHNILDEPGVNKALLVPFNNHVVKITLINDFGVVKSYTTTTENQMLWVKLKLLQEVLK